ncbi:MAG: chloride channel protein [Candidatus Aminicenantia bacterium]
MKKIVRPDFADHFKLLLLAILIGILGGFASVAFKILLRFFQSQFWGNPTSLLAAVQGKTWFLIILIPGIGGLLVGVLIHLGAREAKGHGVPEVMEAALLKGGIIRKRVSIVKALASSLCIGSGGSVGREGPIVQISSSLASTIGQIFKIKEKGLRTLVASGVAAGIAGTFNAPIAGAMFAVEIVLGEFGVASFSPIVIASVIATLTSHYFVGDFAAFKVPKYTLISVWEIGPYILLGIISGLVAIFFIKLLYLSEEKWDKLKFPEYLKPAFGGIIIGLIGLKLPHIFGVGYESINLPLHNQIGLFLAFILIFAKLISTSLTLGSGGSGGVFAPSLFMGAMTGNFIGQIFHNYFPSVISPPGAYSLVGMGAVVAAATHAPITAIIIIFELTNDYKIILPLMLSCIISSFITISLKEESIYTLKLKHKGIILKEGREVNILRSILVKDILSHDYTTFLNTQHIGQIIDQAIVGRHSIFHIINQNNELCGIITLNQLKSGIYQKELIDSLVIAEDIAVPEIELDYNDNLEKAMEIFGQQDIDETPVIKEGKFVGVVKRKDVIETYNNEILKREATQGLINKLKFTHDAKSVNIGKDYLIKEIEALPRLWDKSLKELDLKAKHGIEIILIKRKYPPQTITLPSGEQVIKKGDTLILAGHTKNIEKLISSQ